MKQLSLLLFSGLLSVMSTQAQTLTWTGATSSDWNTASNWSPAQVPTAASTVIMNNGNPPNWPVLANDVTLANMNMGGQIDTKGYSITINNNPSICGVGPVFTNSKAGTPIVLNFNGSNVVSLGGGKYMDSVIFNVSGAEQFYEGWNGIDTFFSKATFNFNGTGQCMIARNSACVYKGDVTVTRNGVGETDIFPSNAVPVSGDFSYTNLVGGASNIGYIVLSPNPSIISGRFNANIINPINVGNPQAYIYNIKNLTTGGIINIKYAGVVSLDYDTLSLASLNVSGTSSGSAYGFGNNAFNANLNISDSTNDANNFNFSANVIKGNSIFTWNSTNSSQPFTEATVYGWGNTYTGNTTFNFNSPGQCIIGKGAGSTYNGNLTVSRTVAGETDIFQSGTPSTVSGNFSYTNMVGGASNIGNTGGQSSPNVISGQFNANIINPINAGNPQAYIYNIKNLTTGGIINIKFPGVVSIGYDSLNLSSLNVSGSSSPNPMGYGNNTFNANLNIADSTTNGNFFNFGANVITGNSVFTLNSNQPFYEACCGGDIFNGNVTFNITNGGTIYLGKNGLTQFGGNLTLNGTNFISSPTPMWPLTFIGSGADTLSFTNAALTFPYLDMQMTKGSTVMLAQPTTVTYGFQFNGGNVLSSAANPIIFNGGGSLLGGGGSDTSHVIGLVEKTGGGSFTFPVGDSAKYFPVTISNPNVAADVYTVNFIPHNPNADGYDTASRASTLQRVTSRGYWDIKHPTGSSNVFVTLGYHYSPGAITDQASLSVAHWNGTLWEDLGNGGTTGNDTVGTVETTAQVGTFSPFTIATTNGILNPLPVTLISFDAAKQGSQTYLNWVVAQEEGISMYIVERSSDGNHFISINTVNSINSAVQHTYSVFDNVPLNGTNYYRLEIVDNTGKITYSDIRVINYGNQNSFVIYPNPAKNYVNIQSSIAGVAYIYNIRGALVKTVTIQAGVNNIDISKLSSGIYVGQMNGQKKEFMKE